MGNYYTPFSLRIPDELLEAIKEVAKKNKRSANKEIEYALQQYVEAQKQANNGNSSEI